MFNKVDPFDLLSNSTVNKFITNDNGFNLLSRYEATLEKSFYKCLHEFERMQSKRMGYSVPVPIAIDIHESE